jgi:hypothetical protein
MGFDQTTSVVSQEELHVTLVGGVQDLEENGNSFVLQLADDRQMLILNKREYGFGPIDISVDLGIKGKDRLIVCRMVARDEGST